MLKTLAIALLLVPLPAYSAEADHYSVPDSEVVDITDELNSRANSLVRQTLERLNGEGGCGADAAGAVGRSDEEKLYDALKHVFDIHGRSVLVDEILSGRLPRTVILLGDSIYKTWDITSGIFLSRSQLTLSPNIKVGGMVIGVDKLEHMFGYGRKYFYRHYLDGMDLKMVLKLGAAAEKIYLGGNVLATGVFSYGDLAANFNGMRFWNHLLQKRDDVLGEAYNLGPYVVCENGRWSRNPARPIDLSRYVDRSVQENYNCSKFATQSGADKFNSQLQKLDSREGESRPFTCPVSRQALEEAADKYRVPLGNGETLDHLIINRDGNSTVSYFDEF